VKVIAAASGSCVVDNTGRTIKVPQGAMVELWTTETRAQKYSSVLIVTSVICHITKLFFHGDKVLQEHH